MPPLTAESGSTTTWGGLGGVVGGAVVGGPVVGGPVVGGPVVGCPVVGSEVVCRAVDAVSVVGTSDDWSAVESVVCTEIDVRASVGVVWTVGLPKNPPCV